jgi:curli biogenesis system outer membrane secretion channel CsgG
MFSKRICIVLLACALSSGCASGLKTSVSKAYYEKPYERVAVMEFKNSTMEQDISKAVTELFVADLLATQRYMVMERTALDKVLMEQGLSQSGAIDPSTATRIGRLAGVDAVFLGSVNEYEYMKIKHASTLWAFLPPMPLWYFGMWLVSEPKIRYKLGLSFRLVDTETGTIVWSADHQAIKKKSLNECVHHIAEKTLKKIPKPRKR